MAVSTEDFVKQIETMSVLDLNNLVKALEERFGVRLFQPQTSLDVVERAADCQRG